MIMKKHACFAVQKFLWTILLLSGGLFVQAQKNATVILPGNYPDPSIVCANNAYYLIHSTGVENPGIPVWQSADLQNWKRIGFAVNQDMGDIWAPDLVFYKGKWYIYFTALKNGIGNFVVTADRPEGPWSNPISMDVTGIDPGHIATPEGRRFLYMSGGTMAGIDAAGTKVTGEQKHVYDPWPVPREYVIECICTEGPKPFFHNNYYYLLLAQGGTSGPSTSHMTTALRSKNVDGPWEYSPFNPVIRTNDKAEKWWSAGHGTLFQSLEGQWYIVFHAYENGFRNLGRQILITPVEWTDDGWFREAEPGRFQDVTGSNFIDEFDEEPITLRWVFMNAPGSDRISFKNGNLCMVAKGDRPATSDPLVITAEHHRYSVETKVTIQKDVNAGLVLYYNNQAQWGISLSAEGITQIVNGELYPPVKLEKEQLSVYLKIINDRSDLSYLYSLDGKYWVKLEYSHDISGFHTNTIGGYRAFKAGLVAFGTGEALFGYFDYQMLK